MVRSLRSSALELEDFEKDVEDLGLRADFRSGAGECVTWLGGLEVNCCG